MKRIKLVAAIGTVLLILCVAAFGLHYYLLHRAYEARLAEMRETYRTRIHALISSPASPDWSHDCHAFLQASVINELLRSITGIPLKISKTGTLQFQELEFTTTEGTPFVRVEGTLHTDSADRAGIAVKGIATLSPPATRGQAFVTRIQLVALEPTFSFGALRLVLRGFFGDLAKAIGQDYLDRLPEIELPISKDFQIAVTGTQREMSFKTRPPNDDRVTGTLMTPSFTLSSALNIKDAFFLADGLHLFIVVAGRASMPSSDPTWAALSEDKRLSSMSDPSVSYFVRINRSAITFLLSQVTSLPAPQRTVSFVSTGLVGNLYYWSTEDRDPIFHRLLWRREKKVYLEHPDALRASVEVSGVEVAPHPTGLASLTLTALLRGHVQLHWHFDPGPSGGPGGNVGVNLPENRLQLTGHVSIEAASAPQVKVYLDAPDSSSVRVEVGLGQFGNIPFDQRFSLPTGELFSAPLPTGLRQTVDLDVGGSKVSKRIGVSDFSVKSQPDTIQIGGKISLESTK
jgi:hypothetical protein